MDKNPQNPGVDPDKLAQLWNIGSDASEDSQTQDLPNIQNYKIVKTLGEGGMGIIYLAEQVKPIKRQVALKVIKPGMDSKQVLARFEAERQTLALLEHPNIAHIYDAGITDHGLPFFVMEYIDGMPITSYCDKERLSIEERLRLFIQVCKGIHHAHQKGIIHRDIKPSNILVAIQDGQPIPKIIDFGISKAISQHLTEQTIFTEQGQLIGTPEYMSPEQADLTNQDIDTRSDIYSLGILLYELLTGALPFDPKTLRKAAFGEIQRIIREEEPPKPSTRLSHLGKDTKVIVQNRSTKLPLLVKRLHNELEWIPLMAIRKERNQRYKSVADFAEDIKNYLKGNPLIAGPESTIYKFKKFVKKRKGLVAAVSSTVIILFISLVVITSMNVNLRKEKENTQKALDKATIARNIAEQKEKAIQVEKQKVQSTLIEEKKAREEVERRLYNNRIVLADTAIKSYNIKNARELLDSCPSKYRGWEWKWLYSNLDKSLITLKGHSNSVNSVCFSPDGKQIVSGSSDKTIKIWDIDSGSVLRTLSGHKYPVSTVCLSSDGKKVVSGSWGGRAKIWEVKTGNELLALKDFENYTQYISFSPDGKQIVTLNNGYAIILWDAETGSELRALCENYQIASSVCFSPDGKQIASGGCGTISVWDADSGNIVLSTELIEDPRSTTQSICFSPDGKRIATGDWTGSIRIRDADSGRKLLTLFGHQGGIESICFSPDGRWIASAGEDRTIRIWYVENGKELQTLNGHEEQVSSVCFSPDGKWIASGSRDKTLKIWDTNSNSESRVITRTHDGSIWSVCFSPDGRHIASGGGDKVKVWDSDTGSEVIAFNIENEQKNQSILGIVKSVCFSPDGKRIALGCLDAKIRIWDVERGSKLRTLSGHQSPVNSVCFSPDGKQIVSGSSDKTIKIWDIDSGSVLRTLSGHKYPVSTVCLSSDGKKVVSGSWDNTIKIWDADGGREMFTLTGHQSGIISVCFSPDGKWTASASEDRTIKIWDVERGNELRMLTGHQGQVTSVCFSPDGKRIVSGSLDKTIKIWDVDTGSQMLSLLGNTSMGISTVCFSPDGNQIISGSIDCQLKIWNSKPRQALSTENEMLNR